MGLRELSSTKTGSYPHEFFAEPTVLLVPITSRVYAIYKYIFLCAYTHLVTKKEGVCRSPLIKIICIYSEYD